MQSLGPLSSNLTEILNNDAIKTAVGKLSSEEGGSFANIMTEAVNTTLATEAKNKLSSSELLTGMSDDLSGLLLDMQKAELSLQLTLQIRNKIIDAYNEVMRMSM